MAVIIKADGRLDAGAAAPRAFQFDDVGQAYLQRVRAEAAKIVAGAQREAAQIKAKAAEEGRQAAMAAVESTLRARLDQQLQRALSAVQQAAHEIANSRQVWQRRWEEHVVELAAALAKRLCRRELSSRPEITLEWVREALELAAGSAQITLRLHPQDHEVLAKQIDALAKAVAGLGPLQIADDPSITPGGCRVDTQFGALDQQIESQLARIQEELLG